jgi:hypothetical protein
MEKAFLISADLSLLEEWAQARWFIDFAYRGYGGLYRHMLPHLEMSRSVFHSSIPLETPMSLLLNRKVEAYSVSLGVESCQIISWIVTVERHNARAWRRCQESPREDRTES